MNVWDSVRRLFGANTSTPSALRNRVDGMAWVRGVPANSGWDMLNGKAVKTVSADPRGFWTIDPELPNGFFTAVALHDDILEPWKDAGDDATDESLAWLPPVPKPEILALPVRQMGERYA